MCGRLVYLRKAHWYNCQAFVTLPKLLLPISVRTAAMRHNAFQSLPHLSHNQHQFFLSTLTDNVCLMYHTALLKALCHSNKGKKLVRFSHKKGIFQRRNFTDLLNEHLVECALHNKYDSPQCPRSFKGFVITTVFPRDVMQISVPL